MTELSLFTGAGGGVLASRMLGWSTIGYVEYDPYCQAVIRQRIADGLLDAAPIFGDIRRFVSDGYAEAYSGMVDVVSGGFPCQPFSSEGKRLGELDPRNMWPATCDVLRAVQPKWAFFENVSWLLVSGYFDRVIGDISSLGYVSRWGCLSAAEVGARHIRNRLWILAYTKETGRNDKSYKRSIKKRHSFPCCNRANVPNRQ